MEIRSIIYETDEPDVDIMGNPIVALPKWPVARPQLASKSERCKREELRTAFARFIQQEQIKEQLPILPPCDWCGQPTGNWCEMCTQKCPRQSVHNVKTTTSLRYAAHALATSNRNVIASWFESAFAQRRSHPAGELAISTVFLPQLSRSLSAPPSRNKNKICTSADYIVLVSCTRG